MLNGGIDASNDPGQAIPPPNADARDPDLGLIGTHSLLQQIIDKLEAISTQRQEPPATIIDLTAGTVSKTHVKLRLQWLVVSGGTVGHTLQLKVGVGIRVQVITNVTPAPLPIYLVVDRGVDLQLVDSDGASVNFAGYIIAYPE